MIVKGSTLEAALELFTFRTVSKNDRGALGGGGLQSYDNVIVADALGSYEVDLRDLWVTDKRWSMLTRQYLNKPDVEAWLDLIEKQFKGKKKAHGVAFLRSKNVQSRVNGTKVSRRWGSCMIGWSFRLSPTPTISMHSRSSYLGFLAPLDVGVAFKLAELVGGRIDRDHTQFRFVWYLEQATFHFFRSLPWWYYSAYADEALKKEPNSVVAKGITRFQRMDEGGKTYQSHGYKSEANKRVRWHQAQGIDTSLFDDGSGTYRIQTPLPSCLLSSLDIVYGKAVITNDEDGDGDHEDLPLDFPNGAC